MTSRRLGLYSTGYRQALLCTQRKRNNSKQWQQYFEPFLDVNPSAMSCHKWLNTTVYSLATEPWETWWMRELKREKLVASSSNITEIAQKTLAENSITRAHIHETCATGTVKLGLLDMQMSTSTIHGTNILHHHTMKNTSKWLEICCLWYPRFMYTAQTL